MLCFLLSNYLLRQMFVKSDKEKNKNNLPQQFSVFLPPWQPAFEKPTHRKMAFSLILFFFFEDLQIFLLQYQYYSYTISFTFSFGKYWSMQMSHIKTSFTLDLSNCQGVIDMFTSSVFDRY